MRLLSRLPYCALLLAACGTDARDGDDAPPDDEPAKCTPADTTATIMVPSIQTGPGSSTLAEWRVDAMLAPTKILAHTQTADDAQRIATIDLTDPAAPVITDVLTTPGAANYYVKARRAGDCAVIAGRHGLGLACAGQPFELANLDRDVDTDHLHAVQTASTLYVFGQTFASYTVVERTGPNAWREIEQYESSISYPTDAALANGAPISCFIDAGDRAVVKYGGGELATTSSARWCKLAVDGSDVHVVTDIGTTKLALSAIAGEGTLSLTAPVVTFEYAPERLLVLDGKLHALSTSPFSLVPLDGSAPTTFDDLDGSSAFDWNPETRALTTITGRARFDGDGPMYPQTFRTTTRCL